LVSLTENTQKSPFRNGIYNKKERYPRIFNETIAISDGDSKPSRSRSKSLGGQYMVIKKNVVPISHIKAASSIDENIENQYDNMSSK
jgi:hypothetical protein